jgi:hypothetical protein
MRSDNRNATTERNAMNRFARYIVAAVLMLCPLIAHAQGTSLGWGQKNQQPQGATSPKVPQVKVDVVGGVDPADTSGAPLLVNSTTKGLQVTETTPLDLKTSGFLLLVSDTTAAGMADSSSVQTAYAGYVVHGFLVRVTPPAGAALPFTRLAISLRTHLNGTADSVSTAPVPLRAMSNGASASADSLVLGQLAAPTSTTTDDSEIIVLLSRADAGATKWAQGIQRYYPIKAAAGGGEVRVPNFSVRERVLSSSGNTNTVTIYAYCTALR